MRSTRAVMKPPAMRATSPTRQMQVVRRLVVVMLCLASGLWPRQSYAQTPWSYRNTFGGQTFSDGGFTMPNAFHGYTFHSPSGGSPIVGIPNVFGGMSFGSHGYSTSNVFGGHNFYAPSGGFMSTTPNVFGGSNFSSGGYTVPNVFGGYNHFR